MTTESGTHLTDSAKMRIPVPGNNIAPDRLVWAEAVAGNSHTTKVLGRGSRLRLADPDEPEYLRALFNTEAAWAAAQNWGS
jgi:hypothetical protein